MVRPVLLGGRAGLRTPNRGVQLLLVWLPVLICLGVVMRESTDSFSSEQTNGPLRHLFEWIVGPVSSAHWDDVHYAMRKTGHFIGYGLLGLAWLRAWLLTWMLPLRLSSARRWRRLSCAMAVSSTMAVAAVDEIHQTYIPSRTGLITDALLDTAGSVVLILILVLFWTISFRRRKAALPSGR